MPLSRRKVLIGGAALTVAAGAALLGRRSDMGGAHDVYFTELSEALHSAGVAQPALIVDRDRLRQNIRAARETLSSSGLPLRVVVKSLPAPQLVAAVAEGMGTRRYMVFNGSMLAEMARRAVDGDLLLGKPLPVQAAQQFYDAMLASGAPFADPQWLVDTAQRLEQYAQLAATLGRRLRINLEIDVGLHRGGAQTADELRVLIRDAVARPQLQISGLMGYDAHVPRVPRPQRAYEASQGRYAAAIDVLRSELGSTAGELTLNAAGSPTYAMHAKQTVANEVSVGSAFLKPTDFDIDTLAHHSPAVFIATPVIKALKSSQVPALEWLTDVRAAFDPNAARAFFIYGGHWLARPHSPPGLQFSSLVGRSSNQELLLGSRSVELRADDYVFFRPTQSEAVLLQFGDLLVYENKRIAARWPTFPVSA